MAWRNYRLYRRNNFAPRKGHYGFFTVKDRRGATRCDVKNAPYINTRNFEEKNKGGYISSKLFDGHISIEIPVV
jgi:hypothetical protein